MAPGLPKPVEMVALKAQIEGEARRDMEAMAGFSGRMKSWWQDYTHDAPFQHQEGVLRLTARGEDGVLRPCCAFVKPLQLGRLGASNPHSVRNSSMSHGLGCAGSYTATDDQNLVS